MKRFQLTLTAMSLTLLLSSAAFGGTITGSRTNSVGTITGSRTGTITGSAAGTITGSRTGTITGSATGTTTVPRNEPSYGLSEETILTKLAAMVLSLVW